MDLTQQQTLSPQMVQSMEILQMTVQDLDSYIETLALENPVIDLLDPDLSDKEDTLRQEEMQRKMDWLEESDQQNRVYYSQDRSEEQDEEDWRDERDSGESLSHYLLSQILLSDYTDTERSVMEFMIYSIDSRGYFTESISTVAQGFSVSEEFVLKLLEDIQSLDPAGVGARDLRECLLLQLNRKKEHLPLTETLIRECLEDIGKKHFRIIADKLSVPTEEVEEACVEIQTLNPKPGNAFSDQENLRYIRPDVLVEKRDTGFEILINEYRSPVFTINSYYQDLLRQTTDPEIKNYLKDKISQAQWVAECISKRSSTLLGVMRILVEKQQEFFLLGPGHKCPMKLSDLAGILDFHESTVSRAMHGKYLQCTWGVYPLNYFLTAVAAKISDREEMTQEQLKIMIRKIIDSEDKKKPLSDQAISDLLEKQNISLSRRTVNKYRTEMGIPDKSGRKMTGN